MVIKSIMLTYPQELFFSWKTSRLNWKRVRGITAKQMGACSYSRGLDTTAGVTKWHQLFPTPRKTLRATYRQFGRCWVGCDISCPRIFWDIERESAEIFNYHSIMLASHIAFWVVCGLALRSLLGGKRKSFLFLLCTQVLDWVTHHHFAWTTLCLFLHGSCHNNWIIPSKTCHR